MATASRSRTKPKKNTKRFGRGQHPDSLANLIYGAESMYGEAKITTSLGITPTGKNKLKKLAKASRLSVSELIERLSRTLTPEDVRKILSKS